MQLRSVVAGETPCGNGVSSLTLRFDRLWGIFAYPGRGGLAPVLWAVTRVGLFCISG